MYRAAFLLAAILAAPVHASPLTGTFPSIDGGTLSIEDWRGRPVLVVNTASLCGYTPQYDDLQALHERYEAKGVVILAVPSNDFRQELATGAEVKEFCQMNFGLTLPMTDITPVRGADAHPFYAALREEGFAPRWNFNKVLISPDGELVETWGSGTPPTDRKITDRIDALLN